MPDKHISGFTDRQLAALEPYRIVQRRDGTFCVLARLPNRNITNIGPLRVEPPTPQQRAALRRLLTTIRWFAESLRAGLVVDQLFLVAVDDLANAFEQYLDDLPW
jgi:hypothetical protein